MLHLSGRYGAGMSDSSGAGGSTTPHANVRAELTRRGIRQIEVAGLLGVAQSGVSARLTGRVGFTADELVLLADWLGIAPARFFEPVPDARPVGEVG